MTDPFEEMVDLCNDEMVELGMLLELLCSATICEMILFIFSWFFVEVGDSISFCGRRFEVPIGDWLARRLTEEVGVPRGSDA